MMNEAVVTAGKISFTLSFSALFDSRNEESELLQVIKRQGGVKSFTQARDPVTNLWTNVVVVQDDNFDPRDVRMRVIGAIRRHYHQNYPDRVIKFVKL